MKKYSTIIISLVLGLFGAYIANAQEESTTGRPIWVLGHAANSFRCLENVIADGGTGVEIDVNGCEGSGPGSGVYWSINHDGGFLGWSTIHKYRLDIDKKNPIDGWKDYYTNINEYLTWDIWDKPHNISLIWLDIKTPKYAKDLVAWVHKILDDKYIKNGKEIPFSIVYGFYHYSEVEPICEWLRDNLWENEGINLAYEGTSSGSPRSGSRAQIQNMLDKHSFPIKKHFMTNGIAMGCEFTRDTWRWQHIIDSREDMKDDKYCARIGHWTCTSGPAGVMCVISQKDDPENEILKGSKPLECDVVLMECQSDFFPAKLAPLSRMSLQKFVKGFFYTNGEFYKFNNGHYRRAKQSDKFYIYYSDPYRVRYE